MGPKKSKVLNIRFYGSDYVSSFAAIYTVAEYKNNNLLTFGDVSNIQLTQSIRVVKFFQPKKRFITKYILFAKYGTESFYKTLMDVGSYMIKENHYRNLLFLVASDGYDTDFISQQYNITNHCHNLWALGKLDFIPEIVSYIKQYYTDTLDMKNIVLLSKLYGLITIAPYIGERNIVKTLENYISINS